MPFLRSRGMEVEEEKKTLDFRPWALAPAVAGGDTKLFFNAQ